MTRGYASPWLPILLALAACGSETAKEPRTAPESADGMAIEAPPPPADEAAVRAETKDEDGKTAPAPAVQPADAQAKTIKGENESAAGAVSAAPAAPAPTSAVVARPASFDMCAACHSTEANSPKRIGPSLFGVGGSEAGGKPDFAYSDAMKASGIRWTEDNLEAFIADPKGKVPGTKMMVAGPKDPAKRREIVSYLISLK